MLLVYNNMRAHAHTHAGCFMDQTMDLEGYRTVYVHRATLLPPADIQRHIIEDETNDRRLANKTRGGKTPA